MLIICSVGRPSNNVDWNSIVAYRSQQGIRNRSRKRFLAAATANIVKQAAAKSSPRPNYRYFGGTPQDHIPNSVKMRGSIDGGSSILSVETTSGGDIGHFNTKAHYPGQSIRLRERLNPINKLQSDHTVVSPFLSAEFPNIWHPTCEWHRQLPIAISRSICRETDSLNNHEISISPIESPIPTRYSLNSLNINFPTLLPSPTEEISEMSSISNICHRNHFNSRTKGEGFSTIMQPSFDSQTVLPDIERKSRSPQRPQNFILGKFD